MKDKQVIENITQSFYDNIASQYHKFYLDWQSVTHKEAEFLSKIFKNNGFDSNAKILDCACGIGTQAIGLANIGYQVTASDISAGEISEAKKRATENNVNINFFQADFCSLSDIFSEKFDIIIAMDNALPHMLSSNSLEKAIKSIISQIRDGGLFIASIRDYDSILKEKPKFSTPYVHKTDKGQRVLFQTWDWYGDNYKFIQYIIDDEEKTEISKFECEYRATRREEITKYLYSYGCKEVNWEFPDKTGFYQPVLIAKK